MTPEFGRCPTGFLERYREIIAEIEAKLEPWFGLRHKATVEVKRVPEFAEKSAPGAYYQGPPLDGEEPGRFYANLYDIKATPKYGLSAHSSLFRAVRLVVDTGIHRFKWSREKAIEYMITNLGNAESDAISEIERYIVNPGQATAYKVGMDFILDQRIWLAALVSPGQGQGRHCALRLRRRGRRCGG